MSIVRPGLEQIDGSGAAHGDAVVWDDVNNVWKPGTSGVGSITPGRNIAVDTTDPTHPVINGAELAVMDGITNPPELAYNEAGDDFVYMD